MAVPIWVLGAWLASGPSLGASAPDIVGGEAVHGDELAQVVAVRVDLFLCTGTVVAPRLVLTAAHCVAKATDASSIRIILGENEAMPLATVGASEWGAHPDFCGDPDCEDAHDFGFIVTDAPISFTDGYITPLTDQDEFDQWAREGDPVLLVGFGFDDDENLGQKRKVEVPIQAFVGTGAEFVAGGDGKDSCNGDSGGPALVATPDGYRLAGVLSRGSKVCGKGGQYGIPYPALCWLNAETGVDLRGGCETCDCVHLQPTQPPGCAGCRATPSNRGANDDSGANLGFAWLLALAFIARRRR